MKMMKYISAAMLLMFSCISSILADYPRDWQIDLQQPATELMHRLFKFNIHIHTMMLVIVILVTLLLAYVCIRFSKKNNPIPSKTSHNTLIEIIWTTIPVLILVTIAIPSLRILYFADRIPESEMTVKVVGHQWFWSYSYPDNGGFEFNSYIIQDKDLKTGQKRLLEVDNRLVLPVNTNIRILATAADVIHSWAVPSFGIKVDAVPGRTNEVWLNIEKPGIYYGQCSELCGVGHGFMPISVEAVSKEDFAKWAENAKTKFSYNQSKNVYLSFNY
jgi:cytochrome c oxidase subunit 2